jgi:hypothetical protein
LSPVPLCRYLYLDANRPVVELLKSGDLLIHIGAELIRHIAMSGLDDNIHVYLHRGVSSFEQHDQASMRPAFTRDCGPHCEGGAKMPKALDAP